MMSNLNGNTNSLEESFRDKKKQFNNMKNSFNIFVNTLKIIQNLELFQTDLSIKTT